MCRFVCFELLHKSIGIGSSVVLWIVLPKCPVYTRTHTQDEAAKNYSVCLITSCEFMLDMDTKRLEGNPVSSRTRNPNTQQTTDSLTQRPILDSTSSKAYNKACRRLVVANPSGEINFVSAYEQNVEWKTG